jgi:hypothetical protein
MDGRAITDSWWGMSNPPVYEWPEVLSITGIDMRAKGDVYFYKICTSGVPMHTKLTLRLEEKVIEQAKQYAQHTGKSLSQIVSEYFLLLGSKSADSVKLTPTVSKLRGSLNKNAGDQEDYRKYLSQKHR